MLEENIVNWLKENTKSLTSRNDVADRCSSKFDISKSYAYKLINRIPEVYTLCNFWDIVNGLNGDLIDEITVLKNLNINKDKWRRLRSNYCLDGYRVVVSKGKTKGVYIGNKAVVEDMKQFIEERVI